MRSRLGFLLLLLLPGSLHAQTVTYEVLALSGDAPSGGPAGSIYGSLFEGYLPDPLQNAAGQHAWAADLEQGVGGVTAADDHALWGPLGPGLAPLMREGEALASAPPGTVLADTGVKLLSLNGTGRALVRWHLDIGVGGVTSDSDDVYWLTDGQGGVDLVVRAGDPAPGTSDVFETFTAFVDASGRVVVRGDTDQLNTQFDTGIWVKPPGGALAPLLLEGGPAPSPPGALFDEFYQPVVNGSGHTALRGTLALLSGGVTSNDDSALWLAPPGGAFSTVARENDPVPGAPGEAYQGFFEPVLNEAGEIAFTAPLKSGGRAVLAPDGLGGHTTVVIDGGPAPGIPGAEIYSPYVTGLNRHGEVAFNSSLAVGPGGVTTADDSGAWGPGPDGQPELRLRDGDTYVGPEETLDVVYAYSIDDALSDRGDVVIQGAVRLPGDPVNRSALFLSRRGGEIVLLARAGGEIEIAPGDVRTVADFEIGPGPAEGSGRVLFSAVFNGGSTAILAARVSRPVPIPGAWGGVLGALALATGTVALLRRFPNR